MYTYCEPGFECEYVMFANGELSPSSQSLDPLCSDYCKAGSFRQGKISPNSNIIYYGKRDKGQALCTTSWSFDAEIMYIHARLYPGI